MDLSFILNPVLPTGKDSIFATRSGVLAVGAAEETLISEGRPSVLDILEITGNTDSAPRIRIERRTASGTFVAMSMPKADGTGVDPMRFREIAANGGFIWDIRAYDTTAGKFKVALKAPIYFPHGFRVLLDNPFGQTAPNVGAILYGRTF